MMNEDSPPARRILYSDAKVLMDQRYEFDAANGNQKSKKDSHSEQEIHSWQEDVNRAIAEFWE